MQLALARPAGLGRLCSSSAARSSVARRGQRVAAPRAQQQQAEAAAASAAQSAAALQQHAEAAAASVADAVAQVAEEADEVLAAVSESVAAGAGGSGSPEQAAAAGVAPPAAPAAGRPNLPVDLNHPAVRVAGIAAAVYVGGSLLWSIFKVSRDPEKRRKKTINKNKAVVDAISKYLPGNRAGLSGGAFAVLKMQTGFSNVEIFRKYLWYLLRERQWDEEALGDLVALKAALGLDDAQVAEALRERAQRVYEKYGTVMVNMEGLTQSGIERKAAARNLFNKLLSLVEARGLLGPEAAATVDLGKIFGVTQRDVLTLRSGYSAEAEGAALKGEDEGEGEGGAAA